MRPRGNYLKQFFSALNISPEEAEKISLVAIERFVTSALEPMESEVVLRYYGINCEKETSRAIGSRLGKSEKGIVKIRMRALRTLNYPVRKNQLAALARSERDSKKNIFYALLGI